VRFIRFDDGFSIIRVEADAPGVERSPANKPDLALVRQVAENSKYNALLKLQAP
jgi:hypothetical protein